VKGTIEIVCGPMFSGKTEELMKRARRATIAKQKVLCFKPSIDNRYDADKIQSHDGRKLDAHVVGTIDELEVIIQNHCAAGQKPDVVIIEEVQFFDDKIVQVIYDLKCNGTRVIAAGLDMDWQGQPFPITAHLLSIGDDIDKQTAICLQCGDDATYSYLKNKSGEQIQVGATDKYEARCFNHWNE
jgi:thymidine kinase